MKRKSILKLLTIVTLVIILLIMIGFCISTINNNNSKLSYKASYEKIQNNNNKSTVILNTTGQVISALEDSIQLHATYYLQEIYVEENNEIKEGEKILQYTNGTYLTAPYDCVITKINVPEIGGICSNENYIDIESVNQLAVKMSIDESIIDKLTVGQKAEIKLTAIGDKIYQGNVTKISSTASNGKFTIIVEFQNDDNVKIGMTADIQI